MSELIRPLFAGIAITIFTVLTGFFFQTLALKPEFFLVPDIDLVIKTVFSVMFWVFVLSFSLPFAAASGFSLYGNKVYYTVLSVSGAITGSAINLAIFPAFKEFLLLGPFYILAIGATTYFSNPSLETKKFSSIKAINNSIKIGLLVMAVGISLFAFYSISQNEKNYLTKFESSFGKNIEGDIEKKIELDIEEKNRFLVTIMNSQPYLNLALRKDEDKDINMFVNLMQTIMQNLNSEEFKQKAIKENKKRLNVHTILSERIPAYDLITSNFSLFQAIILFFSFLFVRSYIIGPIATIFAWVFSKIEENTFISTTGFK